MTNSLQGKAALITGGSTESAQAVARVLAMEGVSIALTGPLPEMLEPVVEEIQKSGGQAIAIPADMAIAEQVQGIVQQVIESFGRLDILILISAVWGGGYIHSHRIDTWDRVMNANLRAPFLLARAALPVLRQQGSGNIIFLNSDSAVTIYEMDGAYGISLHALLALADVIRLENKDQGISVDTLCTGLILSPTGTPADEESLLPENLAQWVLWLLKQPADPERGPVIVRNAKHPPV